MTEKTIEEVEVVADTLADVTTILSERNSALKSRIAELESKCEMLLGIVDGIEPTENSLANAYKCGEEHGRRMRQAELEARLEEAETALRLHEMDDYDKGQCGPAHEYLEKYYSEELK